MVIQIDLFGGSKPRLLRPALTRMIEWFIPVLRQSVTGTNVARRGNKEGKTGRLKNSGL